MNRIAQWAALMAAVCPIYGAWAEDKATAAQEAVIVYCSIDEPFGRKVLDVFKERTGIEVRVEFDTEAGKTTALFNKILSEARAGRPRADVFWSSELFNTMILARKDVLMPYDSPAAVDIPERYRDKQRRWTANALRARVLAFNPDFAHPETTIEWEALGRSSLARYTVMANPLFGTTRGHVAAMFALWGDERAKAFLKGFGEGGGRVVDGNSTALRQVISGKRAFAATDTDDVWVAQQAGAVVEVIYPDMGDGGTLLIPCSVALVKGRPESRNAQKLVDFLVSEDVERMLAESDSRNIPVRESLRNLLNIKMPPETKVTYDEIADAMEGAMEAVREILLR